RSGRPLLNGAGARGRWRKVPLAAPGLASKPGYPRVAEGAGQNDGGRALAEALNLKATTFSEAQKHATGRETNSGGSFRFGPWSLRFFGFVWNLEFGTWNFRRRRPWRLAWCAARPRSTPATIVQRGARGEDRSVCSSNRT